MDADLPSFNLVQQAGDVLVILGLRLGKPGILPHAFQALPAANLDRKRCHAGDLLGIRLPAGEGQHIPQIQRRVPDGIRIKGHIIDRR